MNDDWITIDNFPLYEINRSGQVRNRKRGRIVSTVYCRGYPKVSLYNTGDTPQSKRPKLVFVHRIIWEAFVAPIPSGMHINHIDGDPGNSRLSNLEVVTPRENVLHAHATGLCAKGEEHGNAKLTECAVIEIRHRYVRNSNGYSKLAEQYGVSPSLVRAIVTRKSGGDAV